MTALIALLAAAAAALPADLPDSYTLLCQSEQSTGFDWSGGDWAKRNFKPETYLVKVGAPNECSNVSTGKVKEYAGVVRFRTVCGNLRKVGGTYMPILSMKCDEGYSTVEGNEPVILRCSSSSETFAGAPNGLFQHTSSHGQVARNPPKGYKDSLAIDVGKCSLVQ